MASVYYDPPSGWKFGFPKVYAPRKGETLRDTLIRDGYPEKDTDFACDHCRFLGSREDLDKITKEFGE